MQTVAERKIKHAPREAKGRENAFQTTLTQPTNANTVDICNLQISAVRSPMGNNESRRGR